MLAPIRLSKPGYIHIVVCILALIWVWEGFENDVNTDMMVNGDIMSKKSRPIYFITILKRA